MDSGVLTRRGAKDQGVNIPPIFGVNSQLRINQNPNSGNDRNAERQINRAINNAESSENVETGRNRCSADYDSEEESGSQVTIRSVHNRRKKPNKFRKRLDQISSVVEQLAGVVQNLVDAQGRTPSNPDSGVGNGKSSSETHCSAGSEIQEGFQSLSKALTASAVTGTVVDTVAPFSGVPTRNPIKFLRDFEEAVFGLNLTDLEKIRLFRRLIKVQNSHWDNHLSMVHNNLLDFQNAFLDTFFSPEVQEGVRGEFERAYPKSYEITALNEFFDSWHECLTSLTHNRMTSNEVIRKLIDKLPYQKRDILKIQDYRDFAEFKRRVVRIVKESDFRQAPSNGNSYNNNQNYRSRQNFTTSQGQRAGPTVNQVGSNTSGYRNFTRNAGFRRDVSHNGGARDPGNNQETTSNFEMNTASNNELSTGQQLRSAQNSGN